MLFIARASSLMIANAMTKRLDVNRRGVFAETTCRMRSHYARVVDFASITSLIQTSVSCIQRFEIYNCTKKELENV